MKLTVHLIPIPPPPHAGPDPPDAIFHYTTGSKLRSIINSGAIEPTTAKIEPNEKPVAWFSTCPAWEPTATKCPIPGKLGQLITAKAQKGLVRITVPASVAPHTFQDLPAVAGTSPAGFMGLLLAGLELGADPGAWRFTPTPAPTCLFRDIEFFDFANDRWLAVDLAELACRN
jgi:hypothetical protein